MFDEWVRKYEERISKIPQTDEKAGFAQEKKLIAERISIQDTLLRDMENAKTTASNTAKGVLQTRIKLISEQKKFTQDRQQLELEKREAASMLEKLKPDGNIPQQLDGAKDTAVEELEKILIDIDGKLKQLQVEQTAQAIAKLKAAVPTGKQAPDKAVPAGNGPLDPVQHTAPALALQQSYLLNLSTLSGFDEALKDLKQKKNRTMLTKKNSGGMTDWRPCLALAKRLAAANELEQTAADSNKPTETFESRFEDVYERLQQAEIAADEESNDIDAEVLKTLRGDVIRLVNDVQQHAQQALTNRTKQSEITNQKVLVDKAVTEWLKSPKSDDAVGKWLTRQKGPEDRLTMEDGLELAELFQSNAGKLDQLAAAVEGKKRLKDLFERLQDFKRNDAVQGFFLLNKGGGEDGSGGTLAIEQRKNDPDFFGATTSAQGDYNFYENLGKFTYHVTALANILRKAGSGISVTGLSPGKGGLAGGSCEIADSKTEFHGTNIKDASVVNSQNKVAASSNRQDAMKVYIAQREDTVEKSMKAEDAAKAAQESTVMLRFPIRAEYLGKFDKDPIHLADNLRLLDGTPVPPDDIEVLVHREWVSITKPELQAAYQEMFAVMLNS
jgi:hypothetical protein